MTDDDLRFGDVSGTDSASGSNEDIVDKLVTAAKVLILVYVLLAMVEILFNVPVPFV